MRRLLALALCCGSAWAQPLYTPNGEARLTPLAGGVPTGFEQDGSAWFLGEGRPRCVTPEGQDHRVDDELAVPGRPGVDENGVAAALTPDGSAVVAFGWFVRQDGQVRVRFSRLRCAELAAGGEAERVADLMPDRLPPLTRTDRDADGYLPVGGAQPDELCFVTPDGLRCVSPGPDDTLSVRLALDASTLTERLDVNPGLAIEAATLPQAEPAEILWRLRAPRWLDGRLFLLAEVLFRVPTTVPNRPFNGTPWYAYVLEVDGDALVPWLGPGVPRGWALRGAPAGTPLAAVTDLVYEPRMDALLAWPLYEVDTLQTPRGARADGVGFAVIPLDGEPPAVMRVSHAVARGLRCGQAGCPDVTSLRGAIRRPDGTVQVGDYALAFEPDTFDLDADGLTAAVEAELGSSDYRFSTDGVLLSDGQEAALSGTDPTVPTDDPARPDLGDRHYVVSGLIRREVPAGYHWRTDPVVGGSPLGPLCFKDACYTDDGDRVPLEAGVDGTFRKTLDGRHLVSTTGATRDVLTGRAGPPVPAHHAGVFLSVDRFFVTPPSRDAPFQVRTADGVVYDHEQATCDSELGPCDPEPVEPDPNGHTRLAGPGMVDDGVRLVGWLPDAGRALLSVAGVWERFLVLVHETEPPVLLARGSGVPGGTRLDALPAWLMPTGHGDLLVGATGVLIGMLDGWGSRRTLTTVEGLLGDTPPVAFWGNRIVMPDGDGAPWEVVRVEGGAQPGDVLLFQNVLGRSAVVPGETQLYRVGPRGGVAPQFPAEGLPFREVWGADMRADGLTCIADRGFGTLALRRPAPGSWTPSLSGGAVPVPGIKDCRFDTDGRVVVLTDQPTPRLVRFDGLQAPPELIQEVEGEARALVRGPDGDVRVQADGVRGELWLGDGRHVQVGPAWDLTVDGGFVGTVGPPYTIDVAEDREGYVKLAERPDGLVVVSPWGAPPSSQRAIVARPFAADLVTGETWPLTDFALRATAGVGLVRVPGGPGDPAPMPPAPEEPDPQGDAGVGPDGGPMADVAADDEGCSCSVDAGGGPGGGAVWLGLLVACRRRRRATSTP